MILKKKLFFFLLFISLFLHAGSFAASAQEQAAVTTAEIDLNKYQNIIFSIINNLSRIIENNRASEHVYNTFVFSDNAVRNRMVNLTIDPRLGTVLGGMNFTIYESGEISLVFGLEYLNTYHPESSVHYSVLIHEYRHLYDYFNNTGFVSSLDNERSKYRYELDALRIEVEFIKYYLVGKFKLSRFEEYLLQSFENNNLNSASVVMLRESMDCVFWFNNLENRYDENNVSKDEIYRLLRQEGNSLIQLFNNANEDFARFFHFIEISTFRKNMIRMIGIVNENVTITWEEFFDQNPEIEKIYNVMTEILVKERDGQAVYLSSIYRFWEDDIISRN